MRKKDNMDNLRRGRSKKTWEEMVIHDMTKRNLTFKDVYEREKRRRCCRKLNDPDITKWSPGLNKQMKENDDEIAL